MIREALYTFLSAQAGITDLVGSNIFNQVIPESLSAPAVTYQYANADPQMTSCGLADTARTEFILNSYAVSTAQASRIARAVRDALADYSGMMGDVHVARVLWLNEFDLPDEEPGVFQVSQTYSIWHEG